MAADRPQSDAETAQLTPSEALAALEWYRAAGVDMAISEAPVDRFAASAPPRRPTVPPPAPISAAPQHSPPPSPGAFPGTAPNADPAESKAIAAAAETLDALKAAMEQFEGCALKRRATQLVFADGNPEAEIMLVGEGPGEQEDLIGKPFVGRAGQLLDRMLGAIGLDRTKVYIANMVPWRPPGNRAPSPEEMAQCAPFLIRQVELVQPKILVTLGNVPTKALFETSQGITRVRGQLRDLTVGSYSLKGLATLHPAYLLRTPANKALAWQDMLALKAAIAPSATVED
ncbi:uracil-DNA glycosylase [Devosia sp.]|uniref:uracil-DNA glycosylase n=1 Tax=Devosia sp. TaxID=1871048 RepID=UPI003A8EE7B4